MKKKSEITNLEILQAINNFSTDVEKRFQGADSRLDSVDSRLGSVDSRLDSVDSRLSKVEANQEDMLLKLDNVAYRFEARDLEKRVGVLEGK